MIDGTRVLELGSGLPIWHAGALLRALGAEVVRVVPERELPLLEVDRPSHAVLNAGKGVLRADLRDADARARLTDELARADVLLVGVRPATARAWGLTAERLAPHAPSLIVVALSAFGPDGPDAEVAGHDINATAASGALALEAAGRAPGDGGAHATPIADLAAALYCVVGVLAALLARARGDAPRGCEVSLAEASLALVAAWAPAALVGHADPFESPWYGVYRSRDGVALALGALERWQREWLVEQAVEPPAAGDVAEAGRELVARVVAGRDADDWLQRARPAGVALTRVRAPAEALDDAQLLHRLSRGMTPADPWRRLLLPLLDGGATPVASADVRALLRRSAGPS